MLLRAGEMEEERGEHKKISREENASSFWLELSTYMYKLNSKMSRERGRKFVNVLNLVSSRL
jgi:hypothetical protein